AIPTTRLTSRLVAWATAVLARENDPSEGPGEPSISIKPADVLEKLFVAMDKVPDGYMVRHIRSGSSLLK
uniref:hypothetical protein n=1 Tax=Klebsiella aerogenes TaxID=548 RepID=UPI001952CA34